MSSINLIARDNGVGLSRDLQVLAEVLHHGDFAVTVTGIRGGKLTKWLRPFAKRLEWRCRQAYQGHNEPHHDINIMLEHVWPHDLPFARHNVLMPNPEWFLPRDHRHLSSIDLVLAKTHHAEHIFRRLSIPVTYTGFISRNCIDTTQPRKPHFFHLAGRSHAKGTERLLALWRRHPEWPRLSVVQSPRTARPGPPTANIRHYVGYFDDAELKRLQNAHRFHLCPSETEGFGHYLAEAMSVGALTITVDAAPMNELVTSDRGLLVPCTHTGTQHLATTHFFDETAMEEAVRQALGLNSEELECLGNAARNWHTQRARNFSQRLMLALNQLLAASDGRKITAAAQTNVAA